MTNAHPIGLTTYRRNPAERPQPEHIPVTSCDLYLFVHQAAEPVAEERTDRRGNSLEHF